MKKAENYLFYIVEDHPEVAENNCIFLKKDYPSSFYVILDTPDKLLERLTLEIPSLVVLDLQFGNINGIQSVVPTLKILNTLFSEYPTLNILVYSSEHSYLHPYTLQISNHQGGFAVVSKMQRRQFFLDGAKNALEGLLTLPSDLRNNLVLNPTELQILEFLCKESLNDKEIALKLNLSDRTTQKHIEKIKIKLGLDLLDKGKTNFRVALCMEALRKKLVVI